MTASKRDITSQFLNAANKVLSEKRAADAVIAKKLRTRTEAKDRADEKLEREFGAILQALENLPEKDGKKFRINSKTTNGYLDGSTLSNRGIYTITINLGYGPGTGWPNYDSTTHISIQSVHRAAATMDAKFSAARTQIAEWVANVAPQRVYELQKALEPKKSKTRAPSRSSSR